MRFLVEAKQPIGHRRFVAGAVDENNDPVETWEPAVTRLVFGWGPPAPEEEIRDDRNAVIQSLIITTPTADWLDPRDRLVLAGLEYEVHGGPRDYTRGPFDFRPGYAIQVKRVTELG